MKKFLNIRFAIGLLLVGLFFSIFGGIMTFNDTSYYVETTGIIEKIDSTYDSINETYEYEVTINYKDVDGNDHQVITSSHSSSWHEEDEITMKYNPDDFNDVSFPGLDFIPYVFLGLGLVLVVGAIACLVKSKNQSIENNDLDKVDMNEITEVEIENIKNSTSPVVEYYFHYAYKMNQGSVLETTSREPIFEAIPTHIGIFTKNKFNFINHLNYREEEKEVSHTITKGYGGGEHSLHYNITTESYFKINGINCWTALGKLGYSLIPDIDIRNRKFTYDVKRYGISVATLEAAGSNVITGKDYKLGNLPANGIFKVKCKEEDIEGVFLACFILARTERHM